MGPNGGEDGDGGEMKTFGGEESREAAFILPCFMFHRKMPADRPFGQADNCEDEPDSAGL